MHCGNFSWHHSRTTQNHFYLSEKWLASLPDPAGSKHFDGRQRYLQALPHLNEKNEERKLTTTKTTVGGLTILFLLAAFLFVPGNAVEQSSSFQQPSVRCSRNKIRYEVGSFTSRGKTIHVERFEPPGSGTKPVIIMIHGSGGLLTRTGDQMPSEENFGEIQIACAGYVSLLVHYFDLNGIASTTSKAYMEEKSKSWLETLQLAVDYAASLPRVDPDRIGLFGESLGGYLALSLAMTDARIKAVSEYGGGLHLHTGDDPRKLPPVLVQHGTADTIVPVEEALLLVKLLSEAGVKHTVKLYEGQNHYPNDNARMEVVDRSIRFFDSVLAASE